MRPRSERRLIDGPAGRIEWVIDRPAERALGIAFVAHPHPLYGGSLDNKVVSTLARTFASLGWIAVRHNFRGVGASEGSHDGGRGETSDLLHFARSVIALPDLAAELPPSPPLALAGFSFGSFVVASAARELRQAGRPVAHLVLVGAAAGKWPMPAVDALTLVIHGELDETIPLQDVLAWARDSEVPVIVIPGADHFFHRRLSVIKRLVVRNLAPIAQAASTEVDAPG